MHDIIFISNGTLVQDTMYSEFKKKFLFAKKAKSYEEAKNKSFTKLFWLVWPDIKIDDNFKFDYDIPEWDYQYIHVFKNDKFYDGVCLSSKIAKVSEKEFNHRFFINKKEVDIVASVPKPYDIFYVDTYEDYLKSAEESKLDMFWVVYKDLIVNQDFKFDYYIPAYDIYHKNITHVFKNDEFYDGICLFSKTKLISKKEFNHRFFIQKKEMPIVATTPKPFDIVFISYNEANAEENWKSLIEKYPRALRVHGVKGIHQAHIEAAKLATTDMFWVVDGDAVIDSNFKFEFEYIPFYDSHGRSVLHKIVHVWQSRNPINNLIYGYGGVKLLPRNLTISMDTSNPDMTTSISTEFKSMPSVSNITAFNTDPFSTWRSAFRECCKLASRSIQGQVDVETSARLKVWCVLNDDVPFGFYAYLGALAGRAYGEKNAGDIPALLKINDFDWLNDQFQQSQKLMETH